MVRILRVVGAVGVLGILGIVAWLAMPAAADTLEPTWTVDKVRVVKSESRLYLLHQFNAERLSQCRRQFTILPYPDHQ